MPINPYRRFLTLAGIVFAVLVALSISFCVYVDPYRMYGTERISNKSQIYSQRSLAKAYMLERIRPDTLILGNETVAMGIDPGSQDWPDDSEPVFNASGPDVDVFMAWRLLQHDIAIRPPRLVILGLDFFDFVNANTKQDIEPIRADEARLLVGRDGKPNGARSVQLWMDFFVTTLSRQAIVDSIKTFRLRNASPSQTMTPLGFNPSHEYETVLHTSGAEAVFSHNDAIYRAQYRSSLISYYYSPHRNSQFRALADIVKLAQDNDIQLILFIPPYHSRYLEILHEVGYWPSFEGWKRALVRTVDDAVGDRQDNLIQLYDFSGYDDISGERVPAPGDTQVEMRWYRDSTHYTPALGSLMVTSMMGSPVLGAELNDTTLDSDLERVRRDRDRLFAPVGINGKPNR